MLTLFKQFIKDEFNALIMKNDKAIETDNPKDVVYKTNYIEDFIQFYSNYTKIISEAFNNNNQFNIAFKEVLENIQSNNIKFNNSYLLPYYIDKYFKRSSAGGSCEASNLVAKIYNIFPTLPDKDIFIDCHRNLLSHRLLSNDYNSLDNEKNLIGKLKVLGGVVYTSNVEIMLNDFNNAKQINDGYRKSTSAAAEFFYNILTGECWPNLNINAIALPSALKIQMDNFNGYYVNTFKNRTLQFSFPYSIVEIDYKIDSSKIYTLFMNTIQASIIINVFNEIKYKEISFEEILEITKGDIEDIKSALQSLSNANIKLLLKSDEGKFKLNAGFTSNTKRIKIINSVKKEEIIKKEKIEDDRSHAIEAAIVRIMKGSQRLHHNILIENILTQLENFKVKVQVKFINNLFS
jgi:cullin 1